MKYRSDFNIKIILFHRFLIVWGKKIDFEFNVEDFKIIFDYCACL